MLKLIRPPEMSAFTGKSPKSQKSLSYDENLPHLPTNKTLDINNFIMRLLDRRGKKPGRAVEMMEWELTQLCRKTTEIFRDQPMLLDLAAPMSVCGDVHGQFADVLRLFDHCGYPPSVNYLFLGDYVDRGRHSIETIALMMAYKVKYPLNFFLLRGNHECAAINRIYGFYDEVKRRYSIRLWKVFCDAFNQLPVAAVIEERIFCMHGGLSPDLHNFDMIRSVRRPVDVPDTGLLCDLLWADPDKDVEGWAENNRGISFTFGGDIVQSFCQKQNLDLVVRAHQVVEDGYEFFAKKKLLTLFSAPNYCGEFDNAAAIMQIDDKLMCKFKILRPSEKLNDNYKPEE